MNQLTANYAVSLGQLGPNSGAVLPAADLHLRRQDRRRICYTPLTDEFLELSVRAASEDTAVLYELVERNERLYAAMDKLTKIQKCRVYLYYFQGLKQREIAEMEGVHHASIAQSLKQALKQY